MSRRDREGTTRLALTHFSRPPVLCLIKWRTATQMHTQSWRRTHATRHQQTRIRIDRLMHTLGSADSQIPCDSFKPDCNKSSITSASTGKNLFQTFKHDHELSGPLCQLGLVPSAPAASVCVMRWAAFKRLCMPLKDLKKNHCCRSHSGIRW